MQGVNILRIAKLLLTTLILAVPYNLVHPSQNKEKTVSLMNALVYIESDIVHDSPLSHLLPAYRSGTGAILDSKGLVVTSSNLIIESETVSVTFTDGDKQQAEVLGIDLGAGVAFLKVAGPTQDYLDVADIREVTEGQSMVALSFTGKTSETKPEYFQTVTIGKIDSHVSLLGLLMEDVLFTHPNTHYLHQGSALIDQEGHLVGIGNEITIDIDTDPKIRIPGNVFIPSNNILKSLPPIMLDGKPKNSSGPVWSGVYFTKKGADIVVSGVEPQGLNSLKGLEPMDKLRAINGKSVEGYTTLQVNNEIQSQGSSDNQIDILVDRAGKYINLKLKLEYYYNWLERVRNLDDE